MKGYPYPIIFVHGIQGSWLKNHYPVDYQDEIYWSGVLIKKFNNIHLNSRNRNIDRDIDKFIFPHQSVPLIYESIVDELRNEVTKQTYVFTYDWRKDNRYSAQMLKDFVELVLLKAKTHAQDAGDAPPDKVTLIGHSMGGLVIKWYVTNILSDINMLDKIITIATPYRGSLKAVEALLPGARSFFGLDAQKAMRKASRTLPGVYQLLPTWEKAVIDKDTGDEIDIFKEVNWQDNLIQKLVADYAPDFFQIMLDDAKAFLSAMSENYSEKLREKFYCVYGEGSDTLKQVTVDRKSGNWYDFKNAAEDTSGDGTVHFFSSFKDEAVLQGNSSVSPKNAIRDIVGGQHAQLPNHGDVQDFIVKVLTDNERINTFKSKI